MLFDPPTTPENQVPVRKLWLGESHSFPSAESDWWSRQPDSRADPVLYRPEGGSRCTELCELNTISASHSVELRLVFISAAAGICFGFVFPLSWLWNSQRSLIFLWRSLRASHSIGHLHSFIHSCNTGLRDTNEGPGTVLVEEVDLKDYPGSLPFGRHTLVWKRKIEACHFHSVWWLLQYRGSVVSFTRDSENHGRLFFSLTRY